VAKLIEAGVDWLRFTTPDSGVQARLAMVWSLVCRGELDNGGIISEGTMLGYSGTVVNGQFFGSRADGAMLNLSGSVANQYATAVAATGANCTRVDLQCTVQTEEYDGDYGEFMVQRAFERREASEGRNWAKIRHLRGFGEGDTVNAGSRSSEKYGRLYDKEKQSRDDRYARCWRWEVEYKGEIAQIVARELRSTDDVTGLAIGLVRAQFDDWAFPAAIPGGIDAVPPRASARQSDTQKTLDWLSIQVRPSVGKLIDAGIDRDVILQVLGLDWPTYQGS